MYESFESILFISSGAILGANFRMELIRHLESRLSKKFPSFIVINLIATFLIGYLVAFEKQNLSYLKTNNYILFFNIGLLGSFSTFSAFILEVFEKIKRGNYYDAFFIISTLVSGGILSAFLGYKIAYAK